MILIIIVVFVVVFGVATGWSNFIIDGMTNISQVRYWSPSELENPFK